MDIVSTEKKSSPSSVIFIICAALFVLAVVFGTAMGLRDNTSFYENRSLAALPELSADSIVSGGFVSGAEAFLTDRAVGRTTLLTYKTAFELNVLKRPVVNGIAVTDEALLPFHGYVDLSGTDTAGAAANVTDELSDLRDVIEENGGRFFYLGVPCQYYVYSDAYPDYMDSRKAVLEDIHACFTSAMAERGLEFIDMTGAFAGSGDARQFYFGTDHHYNFAGALCSYTALMGRINDVTGLGLTVLGQSDITLTTWPNPFMGSRNRELYGRRYMGERLVTPELNSPVPFVRFDNGLPADSYICSLPVNDTDVTAYTAYMGGDWGETIIRTDRPELPDCLIFGDSFSNAVETLIYASFNETRSVDLRFYAPDTSLLEYIGDYKPDVVICVRDDTAWLSQEGNGDFH